MKTSIALAVVASATTVVSAAGSAYYYQTYNYESDYNAHTPMPAVDVCGDVSVYPEPPAMNGYYYDSGEETYYPSYDTCENWEGSCPDDTNACRYVQMYRPKRCKSEDYHRGCKACTQVCCKKVYRPRPQPYYDDDKNGNYGQDNNDGGYAGDGSSGDYGGTDGGYAGDGGSNSGDGYGSNNGPTTPSNYGDSGSEDAGNNY